MKDKNNRYFEKASPAHCILKTIYTKESSTQTYSYNLKTECIIRKYFSPFITK